MLGVSHLSFEERVLPTQTGLKLAAEVLRMSEDNGGHLNITKKRSFTKGVKDRQTLFQNTTPKGASIS